MNIYMNKHRPICSVGWSKNNAIFTYNFLLHHIMQAELFCILPMLLKWATESNSTFLWEKERKEERNKGKENKKNREKEKQSHRKREKEKCWGTA